MKGSTAYCQKMNINKKLQTITMANILDTVGWNLAYQSHKGSEPLIVTIETSEKYKEVHADFVDVAEAYFKGKIEIDCESKPWGSDHIPFIKRQVKYFAKMLIHKGAFLAS